MPGDFLAHNFIQKYQTYTGDKALQHYRSFIDKTFMFLSSQLKQTFPAIPVYSAIGNNDSYHGNYYTDPNGAFYHFLTGEHSWGQLFVSPKNRAQFAAVFPQAGYYEVVPPQANDNRIIVLNTVMFSANAVGVNLQSAVDAQFNWLAKRLEAAQTKGYHVWLVYHIPNGADAYHNVNKAADSQAVMFWQSTYNLRFLKLIRQYAAVISGLITGHTHMDGLQYANKKPIIFNTFVTSISPIYGNNPSYKRYYYRNSNLALEDFIVYYFNLAEKPRQWRKEYRFNHVYQPHCTDCLLAEGALHIAYQGKLAEDYQHYYAMGTDSQPITQGGWWYYWCAINYVTQENYQRCRLEGVE